GRRPPRRPRSASAQPPVVPSAPAHDLAGKGLQRVPVVRPVAERDAEPGAAEGTELVDHLVGVANGAAQIACAVGAIPLAEVAAKALLAARGALGVRAEVEAQVDRAHDRPRVAALRLAPTVEHLALMLPVRRPDVGAVPPVGELGRRAQRALLAAPADPDGNARLQRLWIVGSVGHAEVLALEVGALLLGIEEQAHDLRVLLKHVLARPDGGEGDPEGLGLYVVPAGTEPAVHTSVGKMVDGGERLGAQSWDAVGDRVHPTRQPDLAGRHGC